MRYRTLIEMSLLTIICLGFFTIGIVVGDETIRELFKPDYTDPSGLCNNEDFNLTGAASCLREELGEFYYYNLSNVGKNMDLEELKASGGVCSHYANWYCNRAEEMGFDCKTTVIPVGESGHRFAIMSNEEGYCILDQTFEPQCYALDSSILEEVKK